MSLEMHARNQLSSEVIYKGCSLISAIGLITFTVSALWQRALYQVKAGSFPRTQIPNTLICYAMLFGYITV